MPSEAFYDQFNLDRLSAANGRSYRLITRNQIVEVHKSGKDYTGFWINFYTLDAEPRLRVVEDRPINCMPKKVLFAKYELEIEQAELIYNAFRAINDIPDMSRLKDWNDNEFQYCDSRCAIFTIERSGIGKGRCRNFWGLWSQKDTMEEKARLMDFALSVLDIRDIRYSLKYFIEELPPGNYTDGNVRFSVD